MQHPIQTANTLFGDAGPIGQFFPEINLALFSKESDIKKGSIVVVSCHEKLYHKLEDAFRSHSADVCIARDEKEYNTTSDVIIAIEPTRWKDPGLAQKVLSGVREAVTYIVDNAFKVYDLAKIEIKLDKDLRVCSINIHHFN